MSYIIGLISCALLIAADQYTKWLAVERLRPIRTRPFIPGFMNFTYTTNEGAAFGILQGARWVFIIFTVVVLAAIVWFYIRMPKDRVNNVARGFLVLISAGAIGNGIDRFRQGYVVDFLKFEFINFPVFNIADMCVTVGAILMMVLLIFFYKEEPKNKKGHDADDTADNSGE